MTLDEQIYHYLKKIKLRLQISKFMKYIFYGLLLSLSIGSIITTLSLFLPITYLYMKLIMIFVLCLLTFTMICVFALPNEKDAAKLADKYELKERTITALSLSNSDNPFANIQKKDTLYHLENFNYKTYISLKPSKSSLLKIFILIIIFITTLFIPAEPKLLAKKTEENTENKKNAIKKIEQLKEDAESETFISDITKKNINKNLELLKERIEKTRDADSINKLIEKEQINLSLMKQKSSEEFLNKLLETLSKESIFTGETSVPYVQVIDTYKNKAYKTIDKIQVPLVLEKVIKDYFSSLE